MVAFWESFGCGDGSRKGEALVQLTSGTLGGASVRAHMLLLINGPTLVDFGNSSQHYTPSRVYFCYGYLIGL